LKEKTEQIVDGIKQETNIHKTFAYKAIFVEDGVILLFEKVKPFKEDEVKINIYNADLFLEMGDNVALITENILAHLIKAKYLFIYTSGYESYEADKQVVAFELQSEIVARIRGAWEVVRRMGGKFEGEIL